MLGSLKKLFFKDTGEDLATSIPEPVAIAPEPQWTAVAAEPATAEVAPESPAEFNANNSASSQLLALPLQAIFARLPNSLASVVQTQGNGFVSLPTARIVQELSKGSVKIPFGELRHAAPPGTFYDNARHDQVLIELPLEEILTRLHPSFLSRRSDQKQIHVPEEITNIFGPRGEGISLSTAPITAPKPVVPGSTGDTSVTKRGDTSTTRRTDTTMMMRNAPAVASAPVTHTSPTAVVAPLRVVTNETETIAAEPIVVPLNLLCEDWPEMVRVEIRELNLSNAPVALPLAEVGNALRTGKIIFSWKQICAWMKPPVENTSPAQEVPVELPLKIIAPLFMAKHRAPKVQKKVSVAEIPDLFARKAAVEMQGGPETQTKPVVPAPTAPAPPPTKPAIPAPATIPFAAPATPVLSAAQKIAPVQPVVAPTAPVAAEPKLTMKPDNITPLPKPIEAKPAAPIAPVSAPVAVVSKAGSIGEIFGQPGRTNWPPAEVLKNLVTLPGVAGGFVAMIDGLLVAAELPPQFKAETVAAFLPQIFGRMNQYAKELQLGGLSSLTFVVENVSWQVVKSGGIYLVALSKTGETLPSANLNTIAAELGKQIQ